MFDKDKVKMTIDLDGQTTFQPGQQINGTLHVEVTKEVDVTAIRLMARGREKTSFTAKRDEGGNKSVEDTFIHFEHLITFFGFSKGSGRTGGASLLPGTLDYPFTFTIPAGAPPSVHCKMSAGTQEVSYLLRAILDIPRGFDGKKELPFVVVPTMAQAQYDELSRLCRGVADTTVGLVVDTGCCGFDADPRAAVVLSAEMPTMVLLEPQGGGMGNVQKIRIRVTLQNRCRKTKIRGVKIALMQQQRLTAQNLSVEELRLITSAETPMPGGNLFPHASTSLEVLLPVPEGIRSSPKMRNNNPLPTIETPILTVLNVLTISFPGLGPDAMVQLNNVLPFVSAIDPTNAVPMVPCSYCQSIIVPEERLGAE